MLINAVTAGALVLALELVIVVEVLRETRQRSTRMVDLPRAVPIALLLVLVPIAVVATVLRFAAYA